MNLIELAFREKIKIYQEGGNELKPTNAIYKIGIATILFIIISLELFYKVFPMPFDYLLQRVPGLFIFFAVLGVLHFFINPYLEMYNSYHELSDKHLISVSGLFFGWKKKEQLVPYYSIAGAYIRQTIFGRMFNYGTLHVGTRMTSRVELKIKNIQDPKRALYQLEIMREEYVSK